jgi:hypothetical protein
MKSGRFSFLGILILMLVFGALASAQASRTWVSGVGDDVNPCSRTAPCKTFAGAISKTAVAGEIDCLDPGGFGAVTITKAITLDCDTGVGAGSIVVAGTNGIVIAAGAGDTVNLFNLGVNGLAPSAGAGLSGIKLISGHLHLDDVTVFGMTTACIEVNSSTNTELTVNNATLDNCGTAGIKTLTADGTTIVADIRDVRIYNSGNGINAQNGSRMSVQNAQIAFCNPGINQSGLSAAGSVVMVQGSELSSNGTAALQSVAGATMTAFGNTFAANAIIFNTNGGSIFTGGDNNKLTTDAVGATTGPAGKI